MAISSLVFIFGVILLNSVWGSLDWEVFGVVGREE